MNIQIRQKPRVRLAHRDPHDRPIYHAIQGKTVATGATAYLAMYNLRYVLPTRRRA